MLTSTHIILLGIGICIISLGVALYACADDWSEED